MWRRSAWKTQPTDTNQLSIQTKLKRFPFEDMILDLNCACTESMGSTPEKPEIFSKFAVKVEEDAMRLEEHTLGSFVPEAPLPLDVKTMLLKSEAEFIANKMSGLEKAVARHAKVDEKMGCRLKVKTHRPRLYWESIDNSHTKIKIMESIITMHSSCAGEEGTYYNSHCNGKCKGGWCKKQPKEECTKVRCVANRDGRCVSKDSREQECCSKYAKKTCPKRGYGLRRLLGSKNKHCKKGGKHYGSKKCKKDRDHHPGSALFKAKTCLFCRRTTSANTFANVQDRRLVVKRWFGMETAIAVYDRVLDAVHADF
ncbi:hypothetical protein BSKO_13446 [Bryopsis sp. KO-2023]|nr:hypothetical protein BSKO_13446 [Bryopsis sp. KO-2023]